MSARVSTSRAVALTLTLVLALMPALAIAADGKVQILFTGDNGGEVSPCG